MVTGVVVVVVVTVVSDWLGVARETGRGVVTGAVTGAGVVTGAVTGAGVVAVAGLVVVVVSDVLRTLVTHINGIGWSQSSSDRH